MSGYVAIDLSQVPAPAIVEALDYETILASMRADLLQRAPELAAALEVESEMLLKLLQVCAYRELLLRARVNDAARAVMLATATGSDLDNLAALLGVERPVLNPGNPGANPPVAATMESDAEFRRRVQLSLEGFSTAGPRGAYEFHARREVSVKDVSVSSPAPGEVVVTILSRTGNGEADAAMVAAVSGLLAAEDVRPLCDNVIVQSAIIQTYEVIAQIAVDDGPDASAVLADAQNRLETYVASVHAVGRAVRLSGIFAALHTAGVSSVELTSPVADIVPPENGAAWCSSMTVTATS
jgi:phage-related baseplate assembly protein